jgi:hypothetical protein
LPQCCFQGGGNYSIYDRPSIWVLGHLENRVQVISKKVIEFQFIIWVNEGVNAALDKRKTRFDQGGVREQKLEISILSKHFHKTRSGFESHGCTYP